MPTRVWGRNQGYGETYDLPESDSGPPAERGDAIGDRSHAPARPQASHRAQSAQRVAKSQEPPEHRAGVRGPPAGPPRRGRLRRMARRADGGRAQSGIRVVADRPGRRRRGLIGRSTEYFSRGAATEYSPRREPWV